MLQNIKLLLGIDSTDESKDKVIELLINQAIDEALDFTHRDKLDGVYGLESVIEKMVVFNYNRMGTEGLDSEKYSNSSYTYSSDYPDSIMRTLRRYRKLITL